MIDKILELSLRQRAFVLLASLALVAIGLWSATRLPIDAVPDITGVQVQINTEVRTLAAEESERFVTWPIEIEMTGLPGLQEMRSLTKFGLSQVTLQFDDSTDIYRARQLVTERLQAAVERLPHDVAPKLAPISTGLGEIFYYSVSYKEGAKRPESFQEQLFQLREVNEYTIKPLLRTVPGVAEVNESGGYERQFVIQPRPEDLARSGMTFSELADVVAANVENAGGGIVERGGNQLSVRAVTRANTLEDIANLPVKFAAGVKPLLVKELADVSYGSRIRTGAATVNGQETIIGAAMMLTGENSREVAERVKARLAEIQEKVPTNVQIQTEYDRSILINKTIHTVRNNLFEGAILVIAVLFALLGNWRAALIVTAAIPLSFLFALSGMVKLGVSGNLMSLGAVDFGLIIDGAVVIVENVVRQLGTRQHQLGRRLTNEERLQVVLAASKQVANPMFFGVVIIAIVYIPILALTGIEGKMFHPMAVTVMLALTGALILALTLMPVLCSFLLRGRIGEGDNVIIRAAKKIYEPLLRIAVAARWLVVIAAIAVFAGSLWLFTHLGAEFVPKLDEGSITEVFYKPVGISLEESVRIDIELEKTLLRDLPEITRVFTRAGTNDIATDPMPASESDVFIFYKPIKEWPKTRGRPRNKAELHTQIGSVMKRLSPNSNIIFSQPIEERFDEMLEGTKAELSVKIFGDDYDVLDKLAEQIKGILEKTPGAGEIEYETEGRTGQLLIEARHNDLQRYSLSASEVNKAVSAALAGKVVGTAIEGEKRYEIVVRMPDQFRGDEQKIRELSLHVGDHGLLRLGEVADLKTVEVVEPILRDEGRRRAALLVNLDTRDVEGFVRNAEERIKQEVKMPEDYIVEFGGAYKNLEQARARLMVVVPAALALIFILIFLAFGSIRQALLVYTGIPLAVTGGVLSLWLRGMPFSITAAIGFIALSGVAVLNGLVMISYFNQLREGGRSVREAVMEGSLTRLRPVLMTALVASFGFVPMAIATGTGAEVQRPLATVVIGGILSSTFLTLIVLPVLYAWLEREGETAGRRAEPSETKLEPAFRVTLR
jgi:heavy metal efflux system protein